MASVGFGTSMVSVAPAAAGGRRLVRRTQAAAATRGQAAPKKQEKGILDFIVGAIVKDEQLLIETDPLLNKVDSPAPSSASASGTVSKKKPAADDGGGGGGGFSLGGLFAKKG